MMLKMRADDGERPASIIDSDALGQLMGGGLLRCKTSLTDSECQLHASWTFFVTEGFSLSFSQIW